MVVTRSQAHIQAPQTRVCVATKNYMTPWSNIPPFQPQESWPAHKMMGCGHACSLTTLATCCKCRHADTRGSCGVCA